MKEVPRPRRAQAVAFGGSVEPRSSIFEDIIHVRVKLYISSSASVPSLSIRPVIHLLQQKDLAQRILNGGIGGGRTARYAHHLNYVICL